MINQQLLALKPFVKHVGLLAEMLHQLVCMSFNFSCAENSLCKKWTQHVKYLLSVKEVMPLL